MGSVFERKKCKDGLISFQLKFSIKSEETNRRETRYKLFRCRTKGEAKKELNRIERSIYDGTFESEPKTVEPTLAESPPAAELTFEQHFESWLESKRGLRQTTLERYEDSVRLHVIPELGKRDIKDITHLDIKKIYARMRASGYRQERFSKSGIKSHMRDRDTSGLSERTILKTHRTLFQMFKAAMEDDLISSNPMLKVKGPKSDAGPHDDEDEDDVVEALDEAQLSTLLAGLQSDRHYSIFYLAAGTGLRRSELLGLKWLDINFEKGELTVRRMVQESREKGVRIINKTKNRSSKRTIGLGPEVIALLRQVEIQLKADLMKCRASLSKDYLVFPDSPGTPSKPLRPGLISKAFTAGAKRLGFEDISLHILRHTHATLLLSDGIPVQAVAQRLGHSSPVVTLNTYGHVIKRSEGEAVAAMSEVLKLVAAPRVKECE